MIRRVLLTIAVCCFCTSSLRAEDYLLRLDAVGYVNQVDSEEPLEDAVLHSLELNVQPESAFHSKVTIGNETVKITGRLQPVDGGGFSIRIQYARFVDTGCTVLVADGVREKLLDRTESNVTLRIVTGEPLLMGQFSTVANQGGVTSKSLTRYVLNLSKYEPGVD